MEELAIPAAFERVWERVTAVEPFSEAPLTKKQELERFICAEEEAIAFFCALISSCHMRHRHVLCKVVADDKRHLKCLQIEYFVLTGDTYSGCKAKKAEQCGILTKLRKGYLMKCEAQAAYTKAAENRQCELRELYESIACDEMENACAMRKLIDCCFREQG